MPNLDSKFLNYIVSNFITNYLSFTKTKIFLAKILYRFVTIFYGKKNRIIKRNGIYFSVDLSEGIDFSLFLFGNYQKHITSNKFLNLPKDAIVFDVGANFGTISLFFAKYMTEGKIYSFEPSHYAVEKCKKNMTLNPKLAERILLINCFVSEEIKDTSDMKAFSSWKLNGDESQETHPIHCGTVKSSEGVGSITLDTFCINNNITKLDFIKIDTEGYEHNVLNGAKEIISKYRPQIIIELGLYAMKEKNIDFSFYSNYFNKYNYRLIHSKTGETITFENHKKYIPLQGTIDALALPM